MEYIDLSNMKPTLYLCTWNGGEIVEVHTTVSFYNKYKETNLYDGSFKDDWDMSMDEIFDRLKVNDYEIYDNFRIERIK
jgi:hypothetical protein